LITIAALACHKGEKPAAPAQPAAKPAAARTQTTPAPAPAPASETASASANVGDMMPAYTAKTLDGGAYDLASERGKVVLVNVWATWCGPCRFEIPELEKMHTKYADKGFKVVGVSLDEGGIDPVKEFVRDHSMTYPVAMDPDGHLANIFHTGVIPTSVVVDRQGKIVWKKFGAVDAGDKSLQDAVTKALAAKQL
jgi:thiol-disulfide isomerase/thioredoxin